MTHPARTVLLALIGVVLCTVARALQETTLELTRVPGTHVSLAIPEGFQLAPNFAGLMNEQTGTSVMVTEIAGPLNAVIGGFKDPEQLRARGLELHERSDRALGAVQGVQLELTQTAAGQKFGKLMWAFGDEQQTVLLSATYLLERAESDLPVLRRVLDSVAWEPDLELDPFEGIAFRLTDTTGMQLAFPISSGLAFTPDGEKGQSKPLFLCVPGLQPVSGDRSRFARTQSRRVNAYRRIRPDPLEPIEIDGLRGFECTATAEDRELETPSFIYQVILFEGDSHWTMKGIAHADQREEYLPIFKRMARGFERQWIAMRTVNGRCEVTLPRTWTNQAVPGDDDDLLAGHAIGSSFVQILSEPRADFAEGFTLEQYAELSASVLLDLATDSGSLESLEIGGRRALLRVHRLEDEAPPLVYLQTVVEDSETFHQVILWCLVEAEEWSLPDLERVLASFQILD